MSELSSYVYLLNIIYIVVDPSNPMRHVYHVVAVMLIGPIIINPIHISQLIWQNCGPFYVDCIRSILKCLITN